MSDDGREVITLANACDTWNFRVGDPVHCVMTSGGGVRLETRWEKLRRHLATALLSATRWFRPRTVCGEVDHDAGAITMVVERWSWRRWRWERV